MWRFHFVDQSRGQEAEEAAAILADSLARQGCPHVLRDEWVWAERPGMPNQSIYLLFDDSLISSPILRASMHDKSLLLVSSARPSQALQGLLPVQVAWAATVDARRAAFDQAADLTSPLLGGLARLVPWIDPGELREAVWTHSERVHGCCAGAAVRAFNLGYQMAQVVHSPGLTRS